MKWTRAKRCVFILFVVMAYLFGCTDTLAASMDEKRALIAMREIGHEVLMSFGDSTSRVLPIEVQGDTYTISFASNFAFDPGTMSDLVKKVLQPKELAAACIVEVTRCLSDEIVHSFKADLLTTSKLLACAGRMNPEACYKIHVTLISEDMVAAKSEAPVDAPKSGMPYGWLALITALVMSVSYFIYRRSSSKGQETDVMKIGNSRFNQKKQELVSAAGAVVLSHKESELLMTLFHSANDVVSREELLRHVWGDDGDYVGRTLDVFISKLRKKIETDPSLKIVNVRGVGYRLVVG